MSEETTIELPDGMDLSTAKDVLMEYGRLEEPQVIDADTLSAKDEQINEFANVFRDALKAKADLKDDTVEAMPVDALASEFRNEEGDIDVETLSQTPETGTSEADEEENTDTLSAEDKEEIQDALRRADLMESRTPEHADTLRENAAELADVESYEDIELEAL